MQFRAIQRNARISPRKARLSVDLIRGRRVEDAINVLSFDKRRASFYVRKVLESAIANAGAQGGADPMDLRISQCFVDEGLSIRRFRASARGRAQPFRRRCSHITVVVE